MRGAPRKAILVVLAANQRIGEEIKAIPKIAGPGRGKNISRTKGNVFSRETTKPELKAIATKIQAAGGDATISAVLRELKGIEIKDKRADYEIRADRGAKSGDLSAMADAGNRFAVIYADPPWEFKVYSGKGKQRSAERYYDTSSIEAIKALPIGALAAENCTLFLWSVMPELPGALEVIKAWGFRCWPILRPSGRFSNHEWPN